MHDEWDDKLVASLQRELGDGFDIRYPRMPAEEDPGYASWKPALEAELAGLHDGAILVGHSAGATMLVGLLAEQPPVRMPGGIILLAAPFLGEGGWSSDELRFAPDLGTRLPRDVPIHFHHGLDDRVVPPSHAGLFGRAVPQAHIHYLPGRDHQFGNDLGEVAATILSLGA